MTKNDIFYKVLFAIELALLPLIIFADRLIEEPWAICLFIGGLLLVKIWFELFKDRYNFEHAVISAISSVFTFGVLLILFAVNDYINTAIVVIAIVLVVLQNTLYLVMFKTKLPEFIMAVDYCYMLFECVAIGCFVVISYITLPAWIGAFTLILTSAVSVCYKIYLGIKLLVNKKRR